jgi:HK97 family phage major capsid protein
MPTGTTDKSVKDKLRQIEADLAEARTERAAAAQERDDAREKFAGAENLSPNSDEFKEAQAAVAKLGAIDDRIETLKEQQTVALQLLGQDPADNGSHSRAAGDPSDPRGWDSAAVFEDADVKRMLHQYAFGASQLGRQALGEVAGRDRLAADVVGSTYSRRGDFQGIQPQLRRNLSVLDLIPTGTMDANTFPYTQEGGAFTGAAETAEGGLKPEAAITFTDAEATARTIAAWLKVQKQSLADVPALQSIIDSRLRYLVLRRLEAQVLAGSGSAPNLLGILNASGIGAVAYAADELVGDQVLRGLTTVLLADAQATGIVMNPLDWQDALIAKADAGDGHYYSGGPFSVTPQVMWGVPLVPSQAIPQGTVLVGDFAIGAMLLIREGVRVLLSDSDQDDFLRNRVTLLGEMRAALPIFRPAAFATVDLTA